MLLPSSFVVQIYVLYFILLFTLLQNKIHWKYSFCSISQRFNIYKYSLFDQSLLKTTLSKTGGCLYSRGKTSISRCLKPISWTWSMKRCMWVFELLWMCLQLSVYIPQNSSLLLFSFYIVFNTETYVESPSLPCVCVWSPCPSLS